MKRLILVRHATAVDAGPEGSDFHRRLKKRGRREALLMAERVGGSVGVPDLVLSSPADRALETARVFVTHLGIPEERVTLREQLYGGLLPEEFLQIVQRLPERAATVMVFGHDPSFTEFAAFMIPGFRDAIPKAGVLVIEIDRPKWRPVRSGDGRAALFQRPPAPDVQKRIEEDLMDRLVLAIRGGIFTAIRKLGLVETRDVVKTVARSSARLARDLRPFARAGSGRSPAGTGRGARAKRKKTAATARRKAPARSRRRSARGRA
jgi:phosphohistidine phosphatase